MSRAGPRRAAVALAIGLAGVSAPPPAAGQSCRADLIELDAGGRVVAFAVEIADDPEERAQGLMFREDLPRDAGMLFLWPDPAPRTFWMKNTPLSLDMLFLDAAGRVCGLIERAEPFTLDPRPSGCAAQAVLEIHGGLSDEIGLDVGVPARHPAFGPDAAWPCPAD